MRPSSLATVALLMGLLAACSHSSTDEPDSSAHQGEGTTSPASERDVAQATETLTPLVEQMPELHLAPLPDLRLATDLTPPTNRWFSGLVFGDDPQPVFPLPLTFGIDDNSFGFGLPQIVTTADHIVGSNQQDVTVEVQGGATTLVSAYDVASVTLETRDGGGEPLGRTTIAQGSPFVTHVAAAEETLTTSVPFKGSGEVATAETSTGTWGVRLRDAQLDDGAMTFEEGGSAVFFPVPEDGSVDELAAYAVPLTGTTVSFAVETDEVATELSYTTAAEQPTAHGVLPHQVGEGDSSVCVLGTFPTVYGQLTLCPGDTLRWSAPRQQAAAELDLSALDDAQRSELAASVAADVAALPDAPADTYFGGKHAYRTAQLLSIASQVGAADAARRAQQHLTDLMHQWTQVDGCDERNAFCFGYDPDWRGIVGQTPAFGSEQFNDHHFHYGYFLYAAGILAAYDPSVVDDLRPVMTLLAADIAGGADTGITPQWRPYDAYASHSWASGTSEFADGNNQESSSEAVTAWAGLQLWAQAAEDPALEREAVWLLSSEAHAATTYWTHFDTTDPVYDGFEHGVMGINWGGKRDYATWFSAEPSAILGIQLIPMSPSSGYLAGDPDRIRMNVREGASGPLADYVLMYAGLAGPEDGRTALEQARDLADDEIDQGNSRSYLLAYLMQIAHPG